MELLNCRRKGMFLNLQRKIFRASWRKRERPVEVSKLLEMDKGSKYFSKFITFGYFILKAKYRGNKD